MKPFWWQLIVGVLALVVFGILGLLGGLLVYPLGFTLPFENLGMGYEGWAMLGSFIGVTLGVFLAVWGVGRMCKVKKRLGRTVLGVLLGLVLEILLYDYSMHPFLFVVILLFPLAGGLMGFYFKELKEVILE
ncbi:hypothetical protein HYV86_00915 [Candidatus Woesearchaeota archaeon]|nr:hypothetical protein [Candidatus Woesearchaeota archaeon]